MLTYLYRRPAIGWFLQIVIGEDKDWKETGSLGVKTECLKEIQQQYQHGPVVTAFVVAKIYCLTQLVQCDRPKHREEEM